MNTPLTIYRRRSREELIKIGAKGVSGERRVRFQMAEVAISRQVFAQILKRIDRLRGATAMGITPAILDKSCATGAEGRITPFAYPKHRKMGLMPLADHRHGQKVIESLTPWMENEPEWRGRL